jgi:hypothetical protein
VNLSKLVLEGRIPVTARGCMGAGRCVLNPRYDWFKR